MNTTNRISSEQFLHAWRVAWEKVRANRYQKCIESFAKATPWTEFMLTGDKAFLKCVAKELGFRESANDNHNDVGNLYKVEYQHYDMVMMKTSDTVGVASELGAGYPLKLDVVIEHENDAHPENEMWKLILLRAPLKVIVFYNRAEEKIELMQNMLAEANAAFPENKCTEYLFIVGKIIDEGAFQTLQWRSTSGKKQDTLKSL